MHTNVTFKNVVHWLICIFSIKDMPWLYIIYIILWQSVLLVEETGVPGEDHRPAAIQWQTLSYNVVSSTPRHERNLNSQR